MFSCYTLFWRPFLVTAMHPDGHRPRRSCPEILTVRPAMSGPEEGVWKVLFLMFLEGFVDLVFFGGGS